MTGFQGHEALVDRIYEAACLPALWPDVLDRLAQVAGGAGTVLLTASPNGYRSISSPATEADMIAYNEEGWPQKNSRMPYFLAVERAGFVRDVDAYPSLAAMDEDPVIRDFLRPRGYGWAASTAVHVPSGDKVIFSIERLFRNGPVERERLPALDALRPHLARAAMMTARLMEERVGSSVDTLTSLNLPGAVIGQNGRLAAANRQFAEYMPAVLVEGRDRLRINDAAADRLFHQAIQRLPHQAGRSEPGSIPVGAREDRPAMILHLIPIRREARDVLTSGMALLAITTLQKTQAFPTDLIRGLFDLTPAQARVASALAGGGTIDSVSRNLGLGRETVRTHLKSILSKTGTSRQADLVRLLTGTFPLG